VLRLNRAVEGAPISIRGRIFSQGFGTHANSRIQLSTKGLRRFKALVGVDDEKGKSVYASALVRIEGDGREIFRSPVLSSPTLPLPIDIDITGVSELVLITEDANVGLGNNKNCDDHVSWADPVVE
jgi:endo-alpha-N-acetylgalactosaminidase